MTLMRNHKINHHPKAESLADFAAGRVDEASAVVVATHLTLCDGCKIAVGDFEAIGGAVLETVAPVEMNNNALREFWNRADDDPITVQPISMRPSNDFDLAITQPLQRYLKGGIDDVNWRPVAPGLSQHVLDADGYRNGVLRLFKIMPGTQIPAHSHKDSEFTLILRGSYEDELGSFGPGDFADLDHDDTHTPVASGDSPCICLIAANAPLHFKSMIGKAIQPFIGL